MARSHTQRPIGRESAWTDDGWWSAWNGVLVGTVLKVKAMPKVEDKNEQPEATADPEEKHNAHYVDTCVPLQVAQAFLATCSTRGYAIIDSGANVSMASLQQVGFIQKYLFEKSGSDVVLVDADAPRIRFTFADGSSRESLGKAGVPHELGLRRHGWPSGPAFWFTLVEAEDGPALIGLDYLEPAGAVMDYRTGRVALANGEVIQLVRLPTRHWALSLLSGPGPDE